MASTPSRRAGRTLTNWIFFFSTWVQSAPIQSCPTISGIRAPDVALHDVDFKIDVNISWVMAEAVVDDTLPLQPEYGYRILATATGRLVKNGTFSFLSGRTLVTQLSVEGVALLSEDHNERNNVTLDVPDGCLASDGTSTFALPVIWGWLTLLPVCATVVVGLLSGHVLFALVLGVWLGSTLWNDFNPILALVRTFDTHLISSFSNEGVAGNIVFSFFLGGLTEILSHSGGAAGVADKVTQWSQSSTRGQLLLWLFGFFLFFDDYASAVIIGSSMRGCADRLRISREKFAWIVDSTAAPVSSVAPISSWLGFQIGMLQLSFKSIGFHKNAYLAFLEILPHCFYSYTVFVTGIILVMLGRDFGPMWIAETNARKGITGEGFAMDAEEEEIIDQWSVPKFGVPRRWFNAVLPMVSVVGTGVLSILTDGFFSMPVDAGLLEQRIEGTNAYHVLVWTSVVGLLVPLLLLKVQGICSVSETFSVWLGGFAMMLEPVLIFCAAHALGDVMYAIHMHEYVMGIASDSLDVMYLPTVVFTFSAMVSVCLGTSWGTMAGMCPLVAPLAWRLGNQSEEVLIRSMAAAFSGAVFGDHCSPVSDTTVLTCLSCQCPPMRHVQTQLPYALLAAVVALLLGFLPDGAGFHWGISLCAIPVFVTLVVRIWGKQVPVFIPERASDVDKEELEVLPDGALRDLEEKADDAGTPHTDAEQTKTQRSRSLGLAEKSSGPSPRDSSVATRPDPRLTRNPIGRPPSMSLSASIGADWDVEWLPRKVLKDPSDDGLDRLPHMDWDGAMTTV